VQNAVYVWHSAGAWWRVADYSGLSGTLAGLDRGGVLDPVVGASAGSSPVVPADLIPIRAFYPGDSYVDYFGISYWGDTCCFGPTSTKAQAIYDRRTEELIRQARRLGLPTVIAESTPAYVGTGSGARSVAWINRYFDLIERNDIRMASLISVDWRADPFFSLPFWGGYWPEARIERFADVRHAFVRRVRKRRYVQRPAAQR
jgi:hypothetical protein